ncbi:lipase family protein [Pseudomonas sp. JDS08PS003]|uniref:lipase family protein n=1 Tax=Pseudomonas sp. JDS08PS003 TaxID=2497162 RepID=UPI003857353D
MSFKSLPPGDGPSMEGRMYTCPLRGQATSFQLVDEFGDGKPYAGLAYEATDYEDVTYTGRLDANGVGRVEDHYCGPVLLKLSRPYEGQDKTYVRLKERKHYPLPITELQVRAESTRFFNKDGARTRSNPAQAEAGSFYQVEVRELVEHDAHLPSMVERYFPPNRHVYSLFRQPPQATGFLDGGAAQGDRSTDSAMADLGFAPPSPKVQGIALLPNRHHVLEVRPLRALRPMLSTGAQFCALNLYQLALLATLSYSGFGQEPRFQPVDSPRVSFPGQPSSGNWFGAVLPTFAELWQVDADQAGGKAYYPLYEEVPYSRRLEIVPFDPQLYPEVNHPSLGEAQENPANIHFFDDGQDKDGTDTQAYITHHEDLILIAVRGTAEKADALRDMDAEQVPFEEGEGKVHNGFYGAAKVAYGFVARYLDKFYNGQKLVITGHSLGGAVALILSEMLRRSKRYEANILLYTYGSPRVGDTRFVSGAEALVHHRFVNHNDPVPSVPATWMSTSKPKVLAARGAVTVFNAPVGLALFITGLINFTGEPYAHHGTLRHFLPVDFGAGRKSAILWAPGCSTILDQGCARVLQEVDGLPVRGSLLRQLLDNADHKMVVSYIPHCWATLRRWQESQAFKRPLVTEREFSRIDGALGSITQQLRDLDRSLWGRPDAYLRSQQSVLAVDRLRNEINALDMTRQRLRELSVTRIDESDVYGAFAGQTQLLAEGLPRWLDHPENTVQEQLAMMAPPVDDSEQAIAELLGGHVAGAPYHLDIDSLI